MVWSISCLQAPSYKMMLQPWPLTLTCHRLLSFIMVTKHTKLHDPNLRFGLYPAYKVFQLSNATWPLTLINRFFLSWRWLIVHVVWSWSTLIKTRSSIHPLLYLSRWRSGKMLLGVMIWWPLMMLDSANHCLPIQLISDCAG
jgi:hypothetical protein